MNAIKVARRFIETDPANYASKSKLFDLSLQVTELDKSSSSSN